MFSKKTLFSGAICLLVVILYLVFPSRLPFGSIEEKHKRIEIADQQKWTTQNTIFKKVQDEQLYVSQNFGRGQFLQLSNGAYYEVAPHDRRLAAYWATPSPIDLWLSDDEEYPFQITDLNSGTVVRVKETSYDEIQEKIEQMKPPKKEPTFAPPLPQEQMPQPTPEPVLPRTAPQSPPKPILPNQPKKPGAP